MEFLANDYKVVTQSPSPEDIYCYSPGVAVLDNGRIIATMDFGGKGVGRLSTNCQRRPGSGFYNTGRAFLSDDGGETFRQVLEMPMLCARPFKAGNSVYIIGFCRDLHIVRSDDNGETWGEVCNLTNGQFWHQAPSNVWYKGDHVYLVMERMTHEKNDWPVCGIAPVLMRGNVNDDLTKRENWTFADELVFDENIDETKIKEFGVPFFPNVEGGYMAGTPFGWLECQVVQLKKENDWFFDKSGKTFHIFARCWTGHSWTAGVLKVVEQDDGSMKTMFETAPSGERFLYTPIIGGGQSKFHILYDEKTKTYWLATNQFVDSMVDFNKMTPNDRKGYDRSRLILQYSHNCFDWIFAGVVAMGNSPKEARSYPAMAFDGDDIILTVRTGDKNSLNGHDTNKITFHRVKNFRNLIY